MSRIATFALEEANTYTIKGPRAVKSAAVPRRPSGGHRIAPKGVANMSRASCRGAPQPVPNRPFPSLAAVTSSTNKNSIGARADLLPGGARRCVAGVRYTRSRVTRRTTRDPSRQHGARLAERPWGLPGLLRRAGVPVPMSAIAGRRRRDRRRSCNKLDSARPALLFLPAATEGKQALVDARGRRRRLRAIYPLENAPDH